VDYDIIGDVHGQFDKLDALLDALGYRERAGARRHPQRQAIFVGDFIDRGACGVEVVRTVRRMIDAGAALAVMGNHELNAIAWHTPDAEDPGEYLRPHRREPWGLKNRKQHAAFLAQVEHKRGLHREIIDWFLTLPLWLELPQLRVVHACWHEPAMAWLSPRLDDRNCLPRHLLPEATKEPTAAEADTSMSTFAAVAARHRLQRAPRRGAGLPRPSTGAGKSTTMKMIAGTTLPRAHHRQRARMRLRPCAGGPLAAQRLIGYLPRGRRRPTTT
jgi:hypothetical protein